MKLSYHGHSVILIETENNKIIIDPFITGNDLCSLNAEEVEVDVILLTHGHNDHVGDAIPIAKRNNALVVAPFELATYMGWQGVKSHPLHIGGSKVFDFGKVKLTQAFHGSSRIDHENKEIIYMGMPSGILFTAEGKTVYHAGDTALFSDMKLIGELNDIDVAFIPIGDNFTMGISDALIAAKWLKAKKVVPIHFNTFPYIKQNPEEFINGINKIEGVEGVLLESGGTLEI